MRNASSVPERVFFAFSEIECKNFPAKANRFSGLTVSSATSSALSGAISRISVSSAWFRVITFFTKSSVMTGGFSAAGSRAWLIWFNCSTSVPISSPLGEASVPDMAASRIIVKASWSESVPSFNCARISSVIAVLESIFKISSCTCCGKSAIVCGAVIVSGEESPMERRVFPKTATASAGLSLASVCRREGILLEKSCRRSNNW